MKMPSIIFSEKYIFFFRMSNTTVSLGSLMIDKCVMFVTVCDFQCVLFQKMHLLKLNVPAQFMMVALDEGPGPPIKYQYADLAKLYSVVSQLVRCCDVSSKCASSVVRYCFLSH